MDDLKNRLKTMYNNYFDYAASTPPFSEVLQEYNKIANLYFANPSSIHDLGTKARELLKKKKSEMASLTGLSEGYIIFTSSGTEANNLIIKGVMEKYPTKRLLIAEDVHASSWFATKKYSNRVDVLPIKKNGQISIDTLKKMIKKDTILCSIVHGNNETGIVQNVCKIGEVLNNKNVLFHCDGVQAIGHMYVKLDDIPFDFYTFSAHKFGGLRGVGGIFTRCSDFNAQIQGGGQEMNMRAGTENIAGISSTVTALEIACNSIIREEDKLRELAMIFIDEVCSDLPNTKVNSDLTNGIPGLLSLSFPNVKGNEIVVDMDLHGFCISFGSACHSGETIPSRVVVGMGVPKELSLGSVRVSLGRYTDKNQVLRLVKTLVSVVKKQQTLA